MAALRFARPGATWLYEYGDDGTFEVPDDGKYQIEIHGGGSGAAGTYYGGNAYVASGGGSGEIFEISLNRGDQIPVVVGAGGNGHVVPSDTNATAFSGAGESSSFGTLSVAGAKRAESDAAVYCTAGKASGSLASSGTTKLNGSGNFTLAGGEGNINNTSQKYGDGGSVTFSNGVISCEKGKNGAVIITYLGGA